MSLKRNLKVTTLNSRRDIPTIQIRGKLRKNRSGELLKPYLRLDRNLYEQINISSENQCVRFLHQTATSIEIEKCAKGGPDKRYAFF